LPSLISKHGGELGSFDLSQLVLFVLPFVIVSALLLYASARQMTQTHREHGGEESENAGAVDTTHHPARWHMPQQAQSVAVVVGLYWVPSGPAGRFIL
jgi:hypothetical protein